MSLEKLANDVAIAVLNKMASNDTGMFSDVINRSKDVASNLQQSGWDAKTNQEGKGLSKRVSRAEQNLNRSPYTKNKTAAAIAILNKLATPKAKRIKK